MIQDEAGECLIPRMARQDDAVLLGQLPDVVRTIDNQNALADPVEGFFFPVILILNLADDLLENVLHGH